MNVTPSDLSFLVAAYRVDMQRHINTYWRLRGTLAPVAQYVAARAQAEEAQANAIGWASR